VRRIWRVENGGFPFGSGDGEEYRAGRKKKQIAEGGMDREFDPGRSQGKQL